MGAGKFADANTLDGPFGTCMQAISDPTLAGIALMAIPAPNARAEDLT